METLSREEHAWKARDEKSACSTARREGKKRAYKKSPSEGEKRNETGRARATRVQKYSHSHATGRRRGIHPTLPEKRGTCAKKLILTFFSDRQTGRGKGIAAACTSGQEI